MGKLEKSEKLFEAVLKICTEKNIHDIQLSAIAKKAGVSRGWIYKYHGGNINNLIEDSVKYFGEIFSEINTSTLVNTRKDWEISMFEGIKQQQIDVKKYPWIIRLYFKYKGTNTSIGKSIDQIEKRYCKQAASQLQKISNMNSQECLNTIHFLVTIKMGLAFSWLHEEPKDVHFEQYKNIIRSILA